MRKRSDEQGINMTPMIDVVFQLIIFFVCTADMQNKALDESIKLALAPYGRATENKDPREVVIDVDAKGNISIARTYLSPGALRNILRKTVQLSGQTTPVVIRGDGKVTHENVRIAMEACSAAGLWKVSFAAIKESSGS